MGFTSFNADMFEPRKSYDVTWGFWRQLTGKRYAGERPSIGEQFRYHNLGLRLEVVAISDPLEKCTLRCDRL